MPLEDLRYLRFRRAGQLVMEAISYCGGNATKISQAVDGMGSALQMNGLVNALLLQRGAGKTQQPQATLAAAALVIWLNQRFGFDKAIGTGLANRNTAGEQVDAALKVFVALEDQRRYCQMQEEALVFAGQLKLAAKARKVIVEGPSS